MQLVQKTGCATTDVQRVIIWGNHSATQYPDLNHALIAGQPAIPKIPGDAAVRDAWIRKTFIPDVQQRGAAIIAARGASSAASAANGDLAPSARLPAASR